MLFGNIDVEQAARRLRWPAYLIFTFAIVVPWTEVLANMWPFHWSAEVWRFNGLGTLSGLVVPTAVSMFALLLVASLAGDRRAIIVMLIAYVLFATAMLAAGGSFILDAVQTRSRVEERAVGRFDFASALAFGKLLLGTLLYGILAWAAARALRRPAPRTDQSPPDVLVGRRTTPSRG
jgi:hypothetical protein